MTEIDSDMAYLTLEQTQHELVGLLSRFDEVCRAHGLRYTIIYGTLLGAVRHQGFIPWDNDIDVAMPRPDYDCATQHPEWFEGLILRSLNLEDGSGYFLPFAKLYDPKWRVQEAAFLGKYEEYLWLDIFPLDAVPEDDFTARKMLKKQRFLRKRAKWSVQNVDAITHGALKKAVKKVLFPIHRMIYPYQKVYKTIDDNARALKYGSTSRVGIIVWGDFEPSWIEPVEFDNLQDVAFEGLQLKAIPSWDSFLKAYYGNYMQLPPPDKRIVHNFLAWPNDTYENGK